MRPGVLQARTRPAFFNLYLIRQPVTAVVSIGHRVSGVVLALVVPILVYLLQLSLSGPQGYARVGAFFDRVWIRGLTVFLIWAFAHHLLAGVRHLLFDLHVGTVDRVSGPPGASLGTSRASAWIVLGAEACIVILAIVVVS